MNLDGKYLIIAHYHSDRHIRKDLVELVKHFNREFTKILFISTKLNFDEKKKINKYAKIIVRPNYGYDFYSYKVGIKYLLDNEKKLNDNKLIFLMASSLMYFNPIKLLKEFNKIKKIHNKVYTLSKSWEIQEHFQSDIFIFSINLFKNKFFLKWWQQIRKFKSRQLIINKYELGFTEMIRKLDIEGNALFKENILNFPNNLKKKIMIKIRNLFFKENKIYKKNPTHYYWEKIFKKFGLIKIELIKSNPHKINMANLNKYFKTEEIKKIKKD